LGGVGVWADRCEDGQGSKDGHGKLLALGHLRKLPLDGALPAHSLAERGLWSRLFGRGAYQCPLALFPGKQPVGKATMENGVIGNVTRLPNNTGKPSPARHELSERHAKSGPTISGPASSAACRRRMPASPTDTRYRTRCSNADWAWCRCQDCYRAADLLSFGAPSNC
jgi:hypothetical protein